MKEAKRRLRQRAEWRRLPFEGSVTATEITHGIRHGWHPHFHELILLRADSEEHALDMARTLRSPWLASLRAYGLDGASAAFDVRGAAEAGNYVAKWGVAEEMTLSGDKAGKTQDGHERGRLPSQLAPRSSGSSISRPPAGSAGISSSGPGASSSAVASRRSPTRTPR
jgi:hypothetical protein